MFDASDFARYMAESKSTPVCEENVPSDQLPDDCREVALTPTALYRKLDDWGLDSIVIPHGLAWGNTNPLDGNFKDQLDEHEQRYQKLLEVFSGHGSSELFEDFRRSAESEDGRLYCPEVTENFTPCCQQAGVISRRRCDDPQSEDCESEVAGTIKKFLD